MRSILRATREAAAEAGLEVWAVGGCLRDLCAGLGVRDLDLAVAGDAGRFASDLAHRSGGRAGVEERFGTAWVDAGGLRLDLAGLRTETYARPGALPAVRLGATIEDDLGRRDFSVNAVALGLSGPRTGEVVDPYGGLADLAARRLRVLHPRSFADDATRLWRGARYAARVGLRPTAETARLIEEGGRWLAPVSGRRLWAELERTAEERRVLATLRLLDRWGVLEATSAGLRLPAVSVRALRRRPGPIGVDVLLAVLLAPLDAPERERARQRLSPPREAAEAVRDATRLLEASSMEPEALDRIADTGQVGRTAARWIEPERQHALQRELRRWERTRAHLDGRAIEAMGVPAGPRLGVMLRRLRRERYLGTLTGVADARRAVRAWLAEERTDDA
ncbi:MAG: hypothetical protein R3B59_10700 [Dehalococcoidia bacterium]